jgi:hypothetical protein
MKKSVRRSGVTHQNPHLPPNYFAAVLDRVVLQGQRYACRVGVCPTQIVALRVVPGSSGGALRDVPPNLHARAARDRDRQRLLPLSPVWSRSASVGRRPRTDVPESHTAEATGADDVCQRLDDPFSGFGAFRGPAENPARAGPPRGGQVSTPRRPAHLTYLADSARCCETSRERWGILAVHFQDKTRCLIAAGATGRAFT